MQTLEPVLEKKLEAFAHALVDQERARVIVPAEREEKGYWFGGGKLRVGPEGRLYLAGRYRSAGDSRTGLDLGDRGRELALFSSADRGRSWEKLLALPKAALSPAGAGSGEAGEVLSIEGSALDFGPFGARLYVSSEKRVPYPAAVRDYMKPGTGVWSIELLEAADPAGLAGAKPRTILPGGDPRWLHLKDPFLVELPGREPLLGFCHHPFTWASSETGFVALDAAGLPAGPPRFAAIPRGPAWDVAITRLTAVLPLPSVGAFAGLELALLFYDGGECLRSHEEHPGARRRPRGHSCEELGGLGYCLGGDPSRMERLSRLFPAFSSPRGSGSSRYVDVLAAPEGWYASWQQAQDEGSQALVLNFLPREKGLALLD